MNVYKYYDGKVYKIICNITKKMYIGSTNEKLLSRRLKSHKSNYNAFLKGKKCYITSIKIFKNKKKIIELICNTFCNSKDELNYIKNKYIKELNCVNKCVSAITIQEYYKDIDDKIKKNRKIKKIK